MLSLPLNISLTEDLTVCALGVGIVFAGLIVIILLCKILGAVCQIAEKIGANKEDVKSAPAVTSAAPSVADKTVQIPNRREMVAAISAAIAEDLGTDVSAIRIVSIEKI
jgi:sodium pump decarboxylase gamma subunit